YYLVLPQDAIDKEVPLLVLPADQQPEALAQAPNPDDSGRPPLPAEVSAPALDRVFGQLPPPATAEDNAGDVPRKVKPAGDEEQLAALALVWAGGWAIAEHIEELNKVDDEEEEEEEPELEP